jgi:hypothetical protein
MPKPHFSLPKLKPLELDGQVVDLNFFLTTDYQDASAAAVELPGLIEFVNENLQVMVEGKARAYARLKQAKAKAYFDLKEGLWETRGHQSKPTEAAVEHAIELEQPVIDASEQYAVFSGYVSRLYQTIQTLHDKLGITRTSEATRRAMLEEADRPSEE